MVELLSLDHFHLIFFANIGDKNVQNADPGFLSRQRRDTEWARPLFMSFYASFFAVRALDIEAHLVGNPPLFRPFSPSPWALTKFNELYIFFEHLATIIGSTTANQQ